MGASPIEINELAKLCVEGSAPHCVAACPLHVDVKELAKAVLAGGFTEGRKLLENTLLFPEIIARICDRPCLNKCVRREVDDPVQINLLERACLNYGEKLLSGNAAPQKKQRIAIVGSGLSGIFAAASLLKKGYSVTILDSAQQLGGRLLRHKELQDGVLESELQIISGAQIETGVTVTKDVSVEELANRFDAVYIGWGAGNSLELLGDIHPFTRQTNIKNVFIGGSALQLDTASSAIHLAESGKRAATSMERLFQNVSLSANRVYDGPFESKLFTGLDDVEPAPAMHPSSDELNDMPDEAKAEAGRCLQCSCLECMKGCVYLQDFNRHSGEGIRAVVKNINIIRNWGVRFANKFIYSCTLCGRCKKRCPAGIDMGFANFNARRFMWEQKILPPAIFDFPLRDMENSLQDARLVRHQSGHTKSKYALFTGCQFTASMPITTKKLYAFLCEKLTGGVGLFISCCGAPADWAGREELAESIRKSLIADWEELGKPEMLVCCPGCNKIFQEYLPQIPVKFIAEVMPKFLPAGQSGLGAYAYHDPCSSRSYAAVQESGRILAKNMGASVTELPNNREYTQCCGYGGLQYHNNIELTRKTWGERISQSSLPYLTSCSNCRDFFRAGGKECLHILELVFGKEDAKGSSSYAEIDFSKRRQVRRSLRAELLKNFWGDEPMRQEFGLNIKYGEGVQKKMHEQCILEDDVYTMIFNAEQSGRKILSKETGYFMVGQRQGYITYWIEYSIEGKKYCVHNCYSHRMQITGNL